MKLMTLSQELASALLRPAPLAIVIACLALANGNLKAEEICSGGSTIMANGRIIGCAFSTWGPAQQSMCGGPGEVVFSGPNPKNCHICVAQQYAAQIANNDFTGLTMSAGGVTSTDFHCLKCTPPPNGLTAWWTLDEPALSPVVNDFTLNTSPGTRYGATAVPGHDAALGEDVTNANYFDGNSDYLDIPNNSQLNVGPGTAAGTGDFSIDAWVKVDPTNDSGVRVIVEKRTFTPPSLYKGYSFYLYNGYLGVQLADGGTAPGYTNYGAPALAIKDTNWHFVAVSVAREPGAFQVQFTLDRAVVNVTSPARYGDLTNASDLRIGMLTIGTGSVFLGSIDEVEFFSTAVSQADFQSIYTASCYGKCKY